MTGFGEFLGKTGEAAWQLFVWQIAGQIVAADLTPYLTELTYLVNEHHPDIVLPVNDLVTGVVRGHLTQQQAAADALKLGIDGERFGHLLEIARPKLAVADLAQLVVRNFMDRQAAVTEAGFTGYDAHRLDLLTKLAGDAPAPGDLAVALRRKLIPEDGTADGPVSFAQGIREGRLADKYIQMIRELAVQWPTWSDALRAELNGQLTHEQALTEYERLGGDPQFYTWLFNTEGNAPTPSEALDLVNRGVIPIEGTGPDSVSYHQAFLEGPWRNKWEPVFLALREYIIPPRSVVAMVHAGTIDDATAARLLAKSGASEQTIAAFIAEGHHRATAADKQLTQTQIIALYESRIVSQADAHGLLVALNYSDELATFLIELADLRRSIGAVNSAVSRIHTLYTGHKIKRDVAKSTLIALGIPPDQIAPLLADWDLEAAINVKTLTPAQIVDAWHADIISQPEAIGELQTLGYTAYDAWLLLSIKAKAAQPGKPAPGPNPVGTIP